jgi:phosphatidylglycerol---prolipoprotein diacylglyceryl transferase
MLPIVQIGPAAIQLPGLLLLVGVWVGLELSERSAARRNAPAEDLNRLVLIGLGAGLVGARLGYAALYFDVYLADPVGLVALTPVTLRPDVGLVVGGMAALIYAQRRGMPLWPALDDLAPGLAVMGVAVGLAHVASGDAFGAAAGLPWAIQLWGAERHPSQIYETLAAAGILAIILRRGRRTRPAGERFWLWLGLSAGARLLLEAFRGDSVIVLGNLRQPQLFAMALLVLALTALHFVEKAGRSGPTGAGPSGTP